MYRKALFIFVIVMQLCSCQPEHYQRNPFLQEARFSCRLNMRLPEYIKLRYPESAVLVDNVGLRGIVVAHIGGQYMAWDRACPSQVLSACSQMTLESDHTFMRCPCTGVKYHLLNGQPQSGASTYPMLNYQVEKQGDVLVISN